MESNYNHQFELGELLGRISAANNYWLAIIDREPNKVKRRYDAMYMALHQRERNIIWTKTLIDLRLKILKLFPSCSISIDELRTKIERLDEDEIYEIEITFQGVRKTIKLDWY